MTKRKVLKLIDLLDDLKEVNKMILLHSEGSTDKISEIMLLQYKTRRDKLMSYLIDELVEPEVRSAKSFALISKLLSNHYPQLKKEAKKDSTHKYLEELELQIA